MVTVTKTDITNVAPEFASVAEETFDTFIDIARSLVIESIWGEARGKKGIIFMTAHLLAEGGFGLGGGSGSGPVGAVTMEKVGELQRSYSAINPQGMSAMDSLISTTKYGKTFVMLRKTIVSTPLVV